MKKYCFFLLLLIFIIGCSTNNIIGAWYEIREHTYEQPFRIYHIFHEDGTYEQYYDIEMVSTYGKYKIDYGKGVLEIIDFEGLGIEKHLIKFRFNKLYIYSRDIDYDDIDEYYLTEIYHREKKMRKE